MSLTLITGSLSGTTQVGSWGQIYALTDSDIFVNGAIGTARFTLPKGAVFGALALNGSSPFPNDITTITAYGQSEILAVTTTATGGGGGGSGSLSPNPFFNSVQIGPVSASQANDWRLVTSGSNLLFQYYDTGSSNWITDTYLDGTPYSGSSSPIVTSIPSLQDVTTVGAFTSASLTVSASVTITGSLTVTGSNTFTNYGPAIFNGSTTFNGPITASQTIFATASYAEVAITAQTASYIAETVTASYSLTASYLLGTIDSASYATFAETASYVVSAISSSYALTASYISGGLADTASYALVAETASYVEFAQTASYFITSSVSTASYVELAQTASYVENAQTASYIDVTGSGVLVNYNGSTLQLTASVDTNTFTTTASFNTYTASLNNWTSSAYTGSVDQFLLTSSFSAYTSSTTATFAGTSSYTLTASFTNNIAIGTGLGATLNNTLNGLEVTASLRTVNGLSPVNGNITTALTQTLVGDSGSYASASQGDGTASFADGVVWVIAGTTGSNSGSNGQSYIYQSGSVGTWYQLSSSDTAGNDARYLMLAGTNSPMQGDVDFGTFKVSNLGIGTASDDAINLGQLTASFANLQAGVTASINESSSALNTRIDQVTGSLLGYVTTASYNVDSASFSASIVNINNWTGSNASTFAGTASYINVTGSGVLVNWNGSTLQLTASAAAETPSLQDVTTIGNQTSASIQITGSLQNGQGVIASGSFSHAQGGLTKALGAYSHAEGVSTTAKGNGSHAEGDLTTAAGVGSHAEGYGTVANGDYAHAMGYYTIAPKPYSMVQGKWNLFDGAANWILGNGTGNAQRSNLIATYDDKVTITGSLNVSGSITGSLQGTASFAQTANLALTASYLSGSIESASYALQAATASYLSGSIESASYAFFAETASYVQNAQTASYIATASWSNNAVTASYVNITGSGITVNYSGSQIQLTGSERITAYVGTNQVVRLGDIQVIIPSTGNRSLQAKHAPGITTTASAAFNSWWNNSSFLTGQAGSFLLSSSLATFAYIQPGATLNGTGFAQEATIVQTQSGSGAPGTYNIQAMALNGPAPVATNRWMISIEKL